MKLFRNAEAFFSNTQLLLHGLAASAILYTSHTAEPAANQEDALLPMPDKCRESL
ncbi:hypothetical protein CHCC20335_3235 [Bacillus paralicheniformis]|nr:hypothetical protein CHCC20335_3235 [Bacillus paralicheniformis]